MMEKFLEAMPVVITTLVSVVVLFGAHRLLLAKVSRTSSVSKTIRQVIMLLLSLAAVVAVILSLPVETGDRQQLMGLFGLLMTGVLGLSSTSFVSNAMAGTMLRVVKSFHPGDFVKVEEFFGRVTECGLFHTEIQTADRDLMTLPNLFLVSRPVKVVRTSGTVVSAELSLGYDVSHNLVEPLLKQAAADAGLEDPFVQVKDLGDFSVSYRVAGFLTSLERLLTTRSDLRRKMLDVLHANGVEIVSPTFMNQRRLDQTPVIARPAVPVGGDPDAAKDEDSPTPEQRLFDKAEAASRLEKLRASLAKLDAEIGELENSVGETDKEQRPALKERVERRKSYRDMLEKALKLAEDGLDQDRR